MVNKDFWSNKNVLITGNTGFKGSWCHVVLNELGANVLGFSRDITTEPSTYSEIKQDLNLQTVFADILDKEALSKTITHHEQLLVGWSARSARSARVTRVARNTI